MIHPPFRCYVTLIALEEESVLFELLLEDALPPAALPALPLSVLMHFPVNWFTLRGLFMSWGLVPTFCLLRGGPSRGEWGLYIGRESGKDRGICGGLQSYSRGVSGLARLTDGLARLVLGLGRIIDGLVMLENALRPPGLDRECDCDMDSASSPSSSSRGVWASLSPTLPHEPRLSSDWFPSSIPPPPPTASIYRMHFFLRLEKQIHVLAQTTGTRSPLECP